MDETRERWTWETNVWYNAPHVARIPGGETLDDLRDRAIDAVRALAARHAGQTIVLVGHTVVNRVVLLAVLRLDNGRFWRLRQETCAINVFEVGDETFTLARR